MTILSGYVRIYRQLLGHPALKSNGYALGFVAMILRAAWRPCTVHYRGEPVALKRGQLVISQRDLAELCGQPKSWAMHLLARLKSAEMITVQGRQSRAINRAISEPSKRPSAPIITICNYSLYQAETQKAEPSAKPMRNPRANPMNKEGSKKDSPLPPSKGGRREAHPIPRNWAPPEVQALSPMARGIAEQWPDGAYEREAEEFKQWHLGKGDEKANWRAALASRVISRGAELGGNGSNHARRGSHARAGGGSAAGDVGSTLPPAGQLPWEREAAKAAKAEGGNS